jgi:hypothetical protein
MLDVFIRFLNISHRRVYIKERGPSQVAKKWEYICHPDARETHVRDGHAWSVFGMV